MSRNSDPRGRRPSFFARRRNEALQKGKLRAYSPSAPAASSAARPVASTHSESPNSTRSGGSGSRHGSSGPARNPNHSQRQQLRPHTQSPPGQQQQQQQQRGRRPSFYARRQSRGGDAAADRRMVHNSRSTPPNSQRPPTTSSRPAHHRPAQSPTQPQQRANATPRDIPVVGYSQPPLPSLPDPSQMSREDLQLVALRQAAAIRALQQQQQQRQSPRSQSQIRQQAHMPVRPGIPSTEGVTADTIEELAELDRAIQRAQANQIGKAKSKEEQAKEDRDEAVAGCCYDCCCFSLV